MPLATYFTNERSFRKTGGGNTRRQQQMPSAPNFKGDRAQLGTTLFQPRKKKKKSEIARTMTTTTTSLQRSRLSFETQYKTRISSFPLLESIHLTGARLLQQKRRESRLCNPVLGRGTGAAAAKELVVRVHNFPRRVNLPCGLHKFLVVRERIKRALKSSAGLANDGRE